MTQMKLFDRTIEFMSRALDLRTARHKVLSNNIANAETPDFVPQDIPFQKVLEGSLYGESMVRLQQTHPGHLPVTVDGAVEVTASEEDISIDREMAKLAENNLMFQANVQTLIKKLEALRLAITEGR